MDESTWTPPTPRQIAQCAPDCTFLHDRNHAPDCEINTAVDVNVTDPDERQC